MTWHWMGEWEATLGYKMANAPQSLSCCCGQTASEHLGFPHFNSKCLVVTSAQPVDFCNEDAAAVAAYCTWQLGLHPRSSITDAVLQPASNQSENHMQCTGGQRCKGDEAEAQQKPMQ